MLLQVDHSKKIDLEVTMAVEAKKDRKPLASVMADNQMKNHCSQRKSNLIQKHLMKDSKDKGEMFQSLLKISWNKAFRKYQRPAKPTKTNLILTMILCRPSPSKAISSEEHD